MSKQHKQHKEPKIIQIMPIKDYWAKSKNEDDGTYMYDICSYIALWEDGERTLWYIDNDGTSNELYDVYGKKGWGNLEGVIYSRRDLSKETDDIK